MTFRTRLFLTSLVTTALALVVATALVSWSLRRATSDRIERSLVSQARLAAETMSHRQFAAGPELDAEADALGGLVGGRVTLVGKDGVVLGDSELDGESLSAIENHNDRPEIQRARQDGLGVARRYSTTVRADLLYVAVPIDNPALPSLGFVRLALPLTDVAEQLRSVWRSALVAFGIALVAALALSWATSCCSAGESWRLRPSRNATRAATGHARRETTAMTKSARSRAHWTPRRGKSASAPPTSPRTAPGWKPSSPA